MAQGRGGDELDRLDLERAREAIRCLSSLPTTTGPSRVSGESSRSGMECIKNSIIVIGAGWPRPKFSIRVL